MLEIFTDLLSEHLQFFVGQVEFNLGLRDVDRVFGPHLVGLCTVYARKWPASTVLEPGR